MKPIRTVVAVLSFVSLLTASLPGIAAEGPDLQVSSWASRGALPEGVEPGWTGVDPDGWIWMAGAGHLVVMDPLGGATLLGPEQGLPDGRLLDMAFHPDRPEAYLAMEDGLYRMDAARLTFEKVVEGGAPIRPPVAVAFDRTGRLYAAFPGRSIRVRQPGGEWGRLRAPGRGVHRLRPAPDGTVLAISSRAVWRLGEEDPRRVGRLPDRPLDALSTAEGTWVLTEGGLHRFPPDPAWPAPPPEWRDWEPGSLARDPRSDPGAIWIAAGSGGVVRLTREAGFEHFPMSEIEPEADRIQGLHPALRGGLVAATRTGLVGFHHREHPPTPLPAGIAGLAAAWSWEPDGSGTVGIALPRDHYQTIDTGYMLLAPGEGYDPLLHPLRVSEDIWGDRLLELSAPIRGLSLSLRCASAAPAQVQAPPDWEAPSPFLPATPKELLPFTATEQDRLLAVSDKVRLSPEGWQTMQRAVRELLATRYARKPLTGADGEVEARTRQVVQLLRGLGIPARLIRGADGSLWSEAWCTRLGWRPLKAGAPATAWGTRQRTAFPALLEREVLVAARLGRGDEVPRIAQLPPAAVRTDLDEPPWELLTRPAVLVLMPAGSDQPPPAARFPLSPWLSLYALQDDSPLIRLALWHEESRVKLFEIPLQELDQGRQINIPGAFQLQFIPSRLDGMVILRVLNYSYEAEPPQPQRSEE